MTTLYDGIKEETDFLKFLMKIILQNYGSEMDSNFRTTALSSNSFPEHVHFDQ